MTPFKGQNKVTSPFGPRKSPIYGSWENHNGQDITAPNGDWSVRECTGGTVIETSIGYNYGRGNLVRVQCAGAVETYQHLASIAVQKGQKVRQGDKIGVAGTSGDSTGVHLHFEVTIGGKAVEPSRWSDVPNTLGIHPGNDKVDGAAPAPTPPAAIGVGSIVSFKGGNVYATSISTTAATVKGASRCKVTAISESAAHPYHCVSQDGTGVYGWVDAAAIGAAAPEPAKLVNLTIGPMTAGDQATLEKMAKQLGLSVAVQEAG